MFLIIILASTSSQASTLGFKVVNYQRVPYLMSNLFGTLTISQTLDACYTWNRAISNSAIMYVSGTHYNNVDTSLKNSINQISKIKAGYGSYGGINRYWYSNGKLIESDININADYAYANSVTYGSNIIDIQSVMVHELGHTLGIGHISYENAFSSKNVMNETLGSGVTRRYLSLYDIGITNSIYKSKVRLSTY